MGIAEPYFLLTAAITSLALAGFVYTKNRRRLINITWSLVCVSTALWSFPFFLMFFVKDKASALVIARLTMIGAILLPPIFLHFTYAFTEKPKGKDYKISLFLSYCFAIFFLISDFTNLFVSDIAPKMYYRYYWEPGVLFKFFILGFFIILSKAFFTLAAAHYKARSSHERTRVKYAFIAAAIGFACGSTPFFLVYNVNIPPFGNYLVMAYTFIMTYAIVRHQLMDIQVIIKKTLVFASLFIVSFGIFVGITVVTQEIIAGGRLLGLAISSIVIILAVRPLEDFLVRITDKYLFQKKYDYRHLVRQFMDELKTMVLNAHDIAQSTLDFLNSSIRTVNSAILMYNKFTNKYDVIASVGLKDKNFKISDSTGLVNKLRENGMIINLRYEKTLSDSEKKELSGVGAELFIPLAIHNDLLGILCLGKKKSDEEYNDDDIGVLSDLSGALSIAINNAQLFDERADAEKRAMVGTLATGINHEIGNPLNIISIKLQSFRILAQQGLLEKKSKEEIINEVNNIAEQCLESAQRISDITKKVSEFAKPNKKLALDEVSVEEAINETVSILKHELDMARIKLKKDIKCKSPYVITDRGQLLQILFNLIKNAAQAIKKENGRIVVDVDKHGKDGISIKISDNGPGIPAKDIDKIFTPFYTTKEPGKGTGLGLALVNRLVERNNGKIEVNSQEGQGTVFTLIFKGHCYE